MKPRFVAIIATLVLMGCAGSPNQPSKRIAPENLPPLIPSEVSAPLPPWEASVDFTALRDAYGRRSDFYKRCEANRPGKQFMAEVEARNFSRAAEIALTWLKACPVDATVHFWAAAALKESGRPIPSDTHMKWFLGLTDSVFRTGDGKTPATAYVTISIAEEYAVLNRLGLEKVSQALIQGPTSVDHITAKDKAGVEQSLYFNPMWHFIRLAHMFPESR